MTPEEIQQLIATYNEYLDRMADAARHFCEDLLESNYREVSQVLPALVTGLAWVNESLGNFVFMGRIPESQLTTFRNIITSMHETLENKDYVLLRDILEYELLPLLKSIHVGETQVN